jgi:uncharacterized short protein YbdD (DUF466 family)
MNMEEYAQYLLHLKEQHPTSSTKTIRKVSPKKAKPKLVNKIFKN